MPNNEIMETEYRPFKLRDIFFGFLIFAWSQVALAGIIYGTHCINEQNKTSAAICIASMVIGNLLIIAITYQTIHRSIRLKEDQAPPIRLPEIGILIALLIAMIFAVIVTHYLIQINNTSNQSAVSNLFTNAPILAVFHIIIIAPVCEEMAFRYFLLKPGKLWWMRYILSGLLFLSIHLSLHDSPLSIFAYLVPVCFLHGTRLLFNSVRYSMLLHMMYNAIVVVTMYVELKY